MFPGTASFRFGHKLPSLVYRVGVSSQLAGSPGQLVSFSDMPDASQPVIYVSLSSTNAYHVPLDVFTTIRGLLCEGSNGSEALLPRFRISLRRYTPLSIRIDRFLCEARLSHLFFRLSLLQNVLQKGSIGQVTLKLFQYREIPIR